MSEPLTSAIDSVANEIGRLSNAVTAPHAGAPDATGTHVESLTEAVMGLSAAMMEISNAINEIAHAIQAKG